MTPISMMTEKVAELIARNSLPYVKCFDCKLKRTLDKERMVKFLLDNSTERCKCGKPFELERH